MPELKKSVEILACPFCAGPAYGNVSCYESSDDIEEAYIACDYCTASSGLAFSNTEYADRILQWNKLSIYMAKQRAKRAAIDRVADTDQLALFLDSPSLSVN